MSNNEPSAEVEVTQWQILRKELALFMKAQSILDGFLRDTARLELPPGYAEACAITRSLGDESLEKRTRRITRHRAYRRHETKTVRDGSMTLLELAEVDAEHLTIDKIMAGSRNGATVKVSAVVQIARCGGCEVSV